MALNPEHRFVCALQGQILRLSERREVAIYLRNGKLWVADFIDGCGEVIDAAKWFRFNCGSRAAPHARRRMAAESAIPLYEQLESRIEELHRSGSPMSMYEQLEKRIEELHHLPCAFPSYEQLKERIEQLHCSGNLDQCGSGTARIQTERK